MTLSSLNNFVQVGSQNEKETHGFVITNNSPLSSNQVLVLERLSKRLDSEGKRQLIQAMRDIKAREELMEEYCTFGKL